MRVATNCIVCESPGGCSCRASLARFLGILQTVGNRVSTLKLQSELAVSPPAEATIDKLSYELPAPLPISEVISRARAAGLDFKSTRLNDRRWYLRIGAVNSGTYFALQGPRTSSMTFRLVSRPSAFFSFSDYERHLGGFLSDSEISALKITRLDLAIDYPDQLSTILSGFDFARKQTQVAYEDRAGIRTGIRIGRGSEKILVYDKAAEAGLEEPRTRIEIQITSAKLPARSIQGLRKVLTGGIWNPFGQIELNTVSLPADTTALNTSQLDRLGDLKPMLKREGLFSAKRHFNKQGNFARDFKSLISVTPWRIQPSEVFQKQFSTYFNDPNRKEDP